MNNNDFTIFPAIHLKNGEVVDFSHGNLDNPVVFHTDPVACAQQWIDQGARWIQLVNLDAAFNQGADNNWALVERIARLDVNIQFGGGIRSIDDVHWAMKSGIKRVIIGSAAVENPQLMADAIAGYGSDAVILAIDADQQGDVKIHGWQNETNIKATGLAIQMRQLGVTQAIHTSIHLDGSMTGVDLATSVELAQMSGLNIIVGGGIGDLNDIIECYNTESISGVIVGKALYTGKVQLARALQKLKRQNSFDAGLERWKSDQDTPWKRHVYQLIENNLKHHIPLDSPPLTILDAGGGNGLDSLALARMNHHVHIADQSREMLKEAKANAALAGVSSRIETHTLDIVDLSREFADGGFDIVLCHNVIQFTDNLEPLLESLYRVLRPGGLLSLITLNQYALLYHSVYQQQDLDAARRDLDKSLKNNSIFEIDMQAYRADELIQWLELQGYVLEKHYGIGCLYAYWKHEDISGDNQQSEKLKNLELELMDRSPYKEIAQYFQLIARKR